MSRFHASPPMSPASTTAGVTAPTSTVVGDRRRDLERDERPGEGQIAADATASRGGSALVEIDVAITSAVSWNPFVNANASAVATTSTTTTSSLIRPPQEQPTRDTDHGGHYAFLMTMPSRMCADVSVASIALSSTSKMSFHRITTIGSIPLANSDATASREIRSPSFSSRWISIQ